jgi:hypothetical protein
MQTYSLMIFFLFHSLLYNTIGMPAQEVEKAPLQKYRMELVYVFDGDQTEYLFVIGNSGFKTVAALKKFIASLPEGTMLEWAPGCKRQGDEPLLSSEEEMEDFKSYCQHKGIKFVLIPSG